jgi:hypothetical protein
MPVVPALVFQAARGLECVSGLGRDDASACSGPENSKVRLRAVHVPECRERKPTKELGSPMDAGESWPMAGMKG